MHGDHDVNATGGGGGGTRHSRLCNSANFPGEAAAAASLGLRGGPGT